MKFQNVIRNSLFFQSFRIAKSNYPRIGLMALFDAMFLVAFFIIKNLSYYLGTIIAPYTSLSPFLFLVILSVIYYLVILLAYSFLKFKILDYINSFFVKTQFNLNRFWKFYALNLAIALIFLVIMLAVNYILMNLKPQAAPYVFLVLAIPCLLFLYIIVNICQSLFYDGKSLKESLKKGFEITFTKMRTYREIVLATVLFSIGLGILLFGIGYLIRISTVGNFQLYLRAYSAYSESIKWVISVAAYPMILINRIAFFKAARESG